MNRKTVQVAVIAAGVRGSHLAEQVACCPQSARVVAVAEPNAERRAHFSRKHGLADDAQFVSWEELCNSPVAFDAAIVATMDNQHTAPVLAALHRGCHVLVEKPLADTFDDCQLIERTQRGTGRVVSVCHTLRYMEAFRRIKRIVTDGIIGEVVHVEHMEAINHLWFTHNYVRGRWARTANNAPLLLHKCCHDIDFLAWLVDAPCARVFSFGDLTYFTASRAPAGSAGRCLGNCRIQDTCPYFAPRLYSNGELSGRIQELGPEVSRDALLDALEHGPYGACVWQAGNDVVDHQVVAMEFVGGTTATCTMTGFSATRGRRTRLQGSKGELVFDEARQLIVVKGFAQPEPWNIRVDVPDSYHPEDREIVANWLSAICDPASDVVVDAAEALKSHAIVFAAERSREQGRVIQMSDLLGTEHAR